VEHVFFLLFGWFYTTRLYPHELENVHVVIIGCGYAGLQMASELRKWNVAFTVIEPKDYMHHCVAALRAAVKTDWVEKTTIPLKESFGDDYVKGRVVKLDTNMKKVVLESGKEIYFTHCVICVGSTGPKPARSEAVTIKELKEEAQSFSEAVIEAENIAIVGGGAVGVELAGEIIDVYPDKNVTIISATERLVHPLFPKVFQKDFKKLIERRNVKLRYGKVTNLDKLEKNKVVKQTVAIGDDDELESDLVVACIGLPPNRDSINDLVDSQYIDENGRIKVNGYLQVEGMKNKKIFAIGDCCNTQEDKMAAYAGKQAELLVNNITMTLRGYRMEELKEYSRII